MKYFVWFSLLFVSLYSCSVSKQYSKKASWKEDFNQENFDTTYWFKIPRGKADWNRHMSDDERCYEMRDGKMILKGIKNTDFSKDTANYLTGGIFTKDKINFGYGRLEIKAKLKGAKGAWPAFWLLAENSKWPDGGEIDIMERLNFDSIVYQTIHSYYTLTLKIKDNPKSGGTAKINPQDFNVYAVEKYPDSLVFFVNNKKSFTYPKIVTTAKEQFPFRGVNHYLLSICNWVEIG